MIWKRMLRQAAHGSRCPYCARIMNYTRTPHASMPTIDRVLPGRLGGTYTGTNIKVVCWTCNRDKRDLTITEWADILTARNDYRGAIVRGLIPELPELQIRSVRD
jgi:hypothetical protein